MRETEVDSADFRAAMSQFASGVTIVTAMDAEGGSVGFTASAFSSLSLEPPLVLVCLDKRAECFEAFANCEEMAISILAAGQDGIAMRFASRGADKFGPGGLDPGELTGLPLVEGATVRMECAVVDRPDGGDHVILVGKVLTAKTNNVQPLIHYNRAFGRFAAD